MSNIIKYNDFIQINPDQRILSLDKKEKISIIDSMLCSSSSGGKGLLITYDLSHSGRRINNRIYSTKGQQRGIDSLVTPYAKPILKNHDQNSEPIGRFVSGEWQDLYDEASNYLQSSQKMLDIHNAFNDDDPEKIYKTLKSFGLVKDKSWPGLGRMRVQANITDEESIKKFMDGRYLTFSAGSTTDRHVCSICQSDWAIDGMCEHRHGKEYDGETCVFITGDFLVMEGSVVNTPADDLSQLVHMEMRDSKDSTELITDKEIYIDEFIMTDSRYDLGDHNEVEEIQATEQVDAYQEKTKEEEQEEVVKKFDHEMSISESEMMELHQKGETYITQRGDDETMVIKVKYSGSMRKDSIEDEYSAFEAEIAELVEELIDEKTFKVPSGAKGNAQKVLDWKKEKGSEVKGMTPVGWARARQLATKSEIGLSTVKRMSAFNRHRKNAEVAPEFKSTPWKDRGYVAWLGWGGDSGINWAIKISAANDVESKEAMIGDFDSDLHKSSTKTTEEKDFSMVETETTENLDLVVESEEDSEKETELQVETVESATEEQETQDESKTEDSIEVDWELLDLALQGLLIQEDVQLSSQQREELPESAFCGPERSFPIPDCAHLAAAKKLVERYNASDEVKAKIMVCVDEKASTMKCDKSEDYLELEARYLDLLQKYTSLETKLTIVVESFVEKKNEDSLENVQEMVETSPQEEVIVNDTKVSNPSEHISEKDLEQNMTKKPASNLGGFEQSIVDTYFIIKNDHGEILAEEYLISKSAYLPRGFHPNKL